MTKENKNKTISNINISEVTSALMKIVLQLTPEEKVALLRNLKEEGVHCNRKSGRIPYLAEIDFAMNGRPGKGYISNISESGMFIQSYDKPAEGSKITMVFPPPTNKDSVKVYGIVVRTEKDGFAVEFEQRLEKSLKKYDINVVSDIFIK